MGRWLPNRQMITKEIDENQMDAYINVVDNQIKFFFWQIGHGIDIEKVLIALVRD